MSQPFTFALAGNQNCGKTTLFNLLTGANQHVGNWPGVTVEQKTGLLARRFAGDAEVRIIDLPGIYSLSPFSMEEIVSRRFITEDKPDVVVNIVDATNLERNLYLTLQLLELGSPMVIALNMMDEVRARGDTIHPEELQRLLGVPVTSICARQGEGVEKLMRLALDAARRLQAPPVPEVLTGAPRQALEAVLRLIAPKAKAIGIAPHYAAAKLLEGDETIHVSLHMAPAENSILQGILAKLEQTCGMECAAALASQRYAFIEQLVSRIAHRHDSTAKPGLSDRIDRVLTHPVLAIPLFAVAMLLVFWITFGPVGSGISDAFTSLVDRGVAFLGTWLTRMGLAEWLHALLVNGVLTGVGSVLSFMPTIVLLFMCLSILEDSGYMARAAFLMDQPLRALGLSGRSFIPMMIGFGCTVPAVMAARSMSGRRDRRFTILLTPFMSCGAKVPVYALFTRAFFDNHRVLVMGCLYTGGVMMAVAAGLLLRHTVFRGDAPPFIMELPAYRLPTARNVLRSMGDKAKDFLQRAFTVIFLATIAVWFLQSYTFRLESAASMAESMLGVIAGALAPVFQPLGFGSPEASAAILTGVMAKESVVSTLAVLSGVDASSGAMLTALRSVFETRAAAMSFLTFVLMYMPCVASFAAMRRELESRRWALYAMAGQTGAAWIMALLVYHAASFLGV